MQSVARLGRPSVGHATAAGKVAPRLRRTTLPAGDARGASRDRTITDRGRARGRDRARPRAGLGRGGRRARGGPERDRRAGARRRAASSSAIIGVQGPAPRFGATRDAQARPDARGARRGDHAGLGRHASLYIPAVTKEQAADERQRSSGPRSTASQRELGRRVHGLGGLVLAEPLRRPGGRAPARSASDVGVWDESPLRKWDFRGADALAAADRIFTNDMLGLEVGQVRYAPFCDENGKMVGDGTVFKFADDSAWVITALDSDLDHFHERRRRPGRRRSSRSPSELPHLQLQGPRSREVLAGPDATRTSKVSRYFRFWPDAGPGRAACRAGSRAPATRESSATRSSAARTSRGALGRAHRRRREAVRPGRGRDAAHRVGADLHRLRLLPARDGSVRHVAGQGDRPRQGRLPRQGRARGDGEEPSEALRRRSSSKASEVPEYGAAVTKDGEPAGTLTSPCESPTLGKVIGMAVLDDALRRGGREVEVALGDGTAHGDRRRPSHLRPREAPPAVVVRWARCGRTTWTLARRRSSIAQP